MWVTMNLCTYTFRNLKIMIDCRPVCSCTYLFLFETVFSLQLPTGAVPMFGGGANPLAAAIKKHRKQESDEVNNTGSL